MQIELKAKHFYFITSQIFVRSLKDYFKLVNEIKIATVGVADDDLVLVDADSNQIVEIYSLLAGMPEGQVNQINTEMNSMLFAQIQANDGIQEWDDLKNSIMAIRTANWNITANSIVSGKSFLNS